MAQILVTKPGTINQRDKALLRRNGVVAIEADDPSAVNLLDVSGASLSGDEMTLALLKTLSGSAQYSSTLREALPGILAEMMQAKLDAQS
jgi:hypothetical protein